MCGGVMSDNNAIQRGVGIDIFCGEREEEEEERKSKKLIHTHVYHKGIFIKYKIICFIEKENNFQLHEHNFCYKIILV